MMTSLIVRPEKDRIGYVIIYNNHVKVNLRPKFLNVFVISGSNLKIASNSLLRFEKDKPLMEMVFFPIYAQSEANRSVGKCIYCDKERRGGGLYLQT